ncbi:MAG: LysR family transcriptional regulator [Clostridiales bacterium]|nr:LysR family transcriptional regulator [Clostridiales bacterium]
MTDKGLLIFSTVADCGSNTEAARILNMSQSNVSRSITNLEVELDTKLINRDHSPFTLTLYGAFLKNEIDNGMSISQRFTRFINERRVRNIKVGLAFPSSSKLITDSLLSFKHRYPDIPVKLYAGDNASIRHKLLDKDLDIAILPDILNYQDYRIVRTIDDYEWGVAVPEGIELTERSYVEPDDLDGYPLLVPEDRSSLRSISEWYGDLDKLITSDSFNSKDMLEALFLKGNGCSFAPRSYSDDLRTKNISFYICSPRIFTSLYIYIRRRSDSPELIESFMSVIDRIR